MVVPAMGAASLLPLTLHLVVLSVAAGSTDAEGFDTWAELSLWFTGPAHVTFVGMVGLRAYRLAVGEAAMSPWKIYAATVFVSCIPFVVFFCIPPALVAITGMPIVPLLARMERLAERDRAQGLPAAIARMT
jgi:hypothetical protein